MILFVLFVPLERLYPLKKDQKVFREGFKTDLVHFFVNEILVKIGMFFVALPLVLLMNKLAPGLKAFIASLPGIVQFFTAILIADFMGYISHRLHHQIPFLWKLHSVHHSSSKMDWLASVRVHPLNQVISRALGAIPLVLLGFSKETLGAYLIFVGLWAIFIHSNTRFELKWLHKVFATPKFHHWHHCKDMEGRDKNFAGQFPWIDLLFGTYYMPEHWPKEYGIDEPMPAGFVKQMRYPFLKENLQVPSIESENRPEKTDQRGEDETASAGGT